MLSQGGNVIPNRFLSFIGQMYRITKVIDFEAILENSFLFIIYLVILK